MFRTENLPTAERFEAWCEVLARTHAPVRASSRRTADYRARQRLLHLGQVVVWPSMMDPVSIQRTPRLIRQSDPELYHLSLITSGTVGFRYRDCDTLHGPYDLRTNDSSTPWDIHVGPYGEPVEAVSVEVPRTSLSLPVSLTRRVIGRPLTGRQGVGALLANFLATLVQHDGACAASDSWLETVLVDLITAVFARELDAMNSLPAETHRRILALRVRSFIQRHLHDPALAPGTIAAAHHISVSYLHRVFRENGTTVAAWIRRERLERVRRDLADPVLSTVSVQDIAARWGFDHYVSFSRTFRAVYGLSPRDYRCHARNADV